MNYVDHCLEQGMPIPKVSVVGVARLRNPRSQTLARKPLITPQGFHKPILPRRAQSVGDGDLELVFGVAPLSALNDLYLFLCAA
jgi:hypothetical protein